jgi:hypothetical protein
MIIVSAASGTWIFLGECTFLDAYACNARIAIFLAWLLATWLLATLLLFMWIWACPEQPGMPDFQEEIGLHWSMVQALRINLQKHLLFCTADAVYPRTAISQASYLLKLSDHAQK